MNRSDSCSTESSISTDGISEESYEKSSSSKEKQRQQEKCIIYLTVSVSILIVIIFTLTLSQTFTLYRLINHSCDEGCQKLEKEDMFTYTLLNTDESNRISYMGIGRVKSKESLNDRNLVFHDGQFLSYFSRSLFRKSPGLFKVSTDLYCCKKGVKRMRGDVSGCKLSKRDVIVFIQGKTQEEIETLLFEFEFVRFMAKNEILAVGGIEICDLENENVAIDLKDILPDESKDEWYCAGFCNAIPIELFIELHPEIVPEIMYMEELDYGSAKSVLDDAYLEMMQDCHQSSTVGMINVEEDDPYFFDINLKFAVEILEVFCQGLEGSNPYNEKIIYTPCVADMVRSNCKPKSGFMFDNEFLYVPMPF